jgi:hypothetical protein
MDLEDLRTQKQSYLRETILEAGYDPQNFVEYLEVIKKRSPDIDAWTLEELKEEVANYKQNYVSQNESQDKNSLHSETERSESLEVGNLSTKDPEDGHSGKHKGSSDMEAEFDKYEDAKECKDKIFAIKTQGKLITTKKPMSNVEGNIYGVIIE